MKLIDKAAVVTEIERQQRKLCVLSQSNEVEFRKKAAIQNGVYCSVLSFLDTLEVKEVNEEPAETYMQVFEKKFPILPTLKGKQLSKFKNFLNKCQQTFGLQEFGIYPIQAKLFEKLTLLWAAWGAENLQGIGKIEGESDVAKEVDLKKEYRDYINCDNGHTMFEIAKHFFELGLKARGGK